MSEAVARARELLAAATPRPWEVRNRDCGDVDVVKDHERVEHICTVGDELDSGALADAELIAAAPTLLAELVAEVERLRARLDAVMAIHSDRNGDCDECEMGTGQGVSWPCDTYTTALGVES